MSRKRERFSSNIFIKTDNETNFCSDKSNNETKSSKKYYNSTKRFYEFKSSFEENCEYFFEKTSSSSRKYRNSHQTKFLSNIRQRFGFSHEDSSIRGKRFFRELGNSSSKLFLSKYESFDFRKFRKQSSPKFSIKFRQKYRELTSRF